jgi:hypothetical protein
MRWTTGLACAAALIATSGTAQTPSAKWGRVSDAHGSSFEAPISLLTREPDPSATVFLADGGAVRVTMDTVTESRPGFPGNDPKGDMDLKRSDCTQWPPSYYVLKERLAAYSCTKGDKVTYYAARYSPSGSVSLYVEYPQTQSVFWDKAVARMSASMRQIERREVR